MIARMFEDLVDPATCGELTPAAMVDAIGAFHRAEAAMVAHKLTMIARLLADHEASAAAEEKTWAYDGWAAIRDQIAPAMRLSPRRASTQMRLAEGLARLPKTAALLAAGVINIRVAETLVYRTELLLPAVQDVVDTELARQAGGYTVLSDDDLVLAIDAVIEEHDPDAVRRYRDAAQSCDVGFGKRDDATGTASIYGRVSAADAELGRRVLDALAATVCANDPRSKGDLRAAAQGAVYRRQNRLVCQCGDPQCVAASLPSAVPSAVIHVLAEHGALEHALAQIEELRQTQSTTPAVTPPSIDYEVLAREADAAEAARTPTPPAPPPWENQPTTTQPEQDVEPASEPEATPAPKAERETEAEAATQPTAGDADSDWSHWFTTDTSAVDDDTEEPPWAQQADTDNTDVEESKTRDDNTFDAEPNPSKESNRSGADHPEVTSPSADATDKDDSDSEELDIAQPVPDADADADADSGSEASAAGDTAADDEPADDDEPTDGDDGDDDIGEPPWGGGSAPQPPPKPRGPDTGSGSTAATPDPATDRVNNAALQPDSPPGQQQLPPQVPAALTPPRRPRPAVTLGGTLIPLDQLADLLRNGATVTALPIPTAAPSAGYKFTGTTRDFILCRDLRCRFPGCNRKAEYADIDHTIPHGDGGATHPSNGKALCREHHLAKTFGQGWSDQQLPNGIVRWTAPTGHTYVTQPTSRVLFPDWDPTTAPLPPPPPTKRRKATPGVTMPLRKRTREQDRQHHINTERDYNALQRALGKPVRRPPFR